MSFVYKNRLEQFSQDKRKYKAVARNLAFARLLFFILIIAGIYFYWGHPIPLILIVFGGGLIFVRLVMFSGDANNKMRFFEQLMTLNENELAAIKGDYHNPQDGKEFINHQHNFSNDLDIFGEDSVFGMMNRTVSHYGKNALASWMSKPLEEVADIENRQSSFKELTGMLDWRQNLLATAMLHPVTKQDAIKVSQWKKGEFEYASSTLHQLIRFVFPVITFSLLILASFNFISWTLFFLYLLLPLGYLGTYLKKINAEYSQIDQLERKFSVLSEMLILIENQEFKSDLNRKWQGELSVNGKQASQVILELKGILDKFEQRNNMLLGIILNAFLLWDLHLIQKMRSWKASNFQNFANWMKVIGDFEAACSIANFAYNRSDCKYPRLMDQPYHFVGEDMNHPMLQPNISVGNNFSLINQGNVKIVTGANMAGKSTFLRTLGLNLVLGMIGSPLSCSKLEFNPLPLFSSMRTEDSLTDNSSFFHAELSRLARISDVLKEGKPRFVILDEILKGTNSVDKAKGSYAFVEKLISYPMMGVIATHDLSLCELADKYPEKIENLNFEVEFVNDNLSFDYKLRKGVCQNMNASFLLQKMGIVDAY